MNLRKFGRGLVLPHKIIMRIINIFYKRYNTTEPILDFGSGTLFWSEKFINEYHKDIIAIDTLYTERIPVTKEENIHIHCFPNLNSSSYKGNFSMIFTCDVLHHIEPSRMNLLLESFSTRTNLIIIKDIEEEDFLGNIQNKIHDFIINRQIVSNISSKKIKKLLSDRGFKIKIFHIKKCGYPHFLLVAYK